MTSKEVIYTGDYTWALDKITRDLMKKHLISGDIYEIEGIREFGIYKGYYIIKNCFYPTESFVKNMSDYKDIFGRNYNLR